MIAKLISWNSFLQTQEDITDAIPSIRTDAIPSTNTDATSSTSTDAAPSISIKIVQSPIIEVEKVIIVITH